MKASKLEFLTLIKASNNELNCRPCFAEEIFLIPGFEPIFCKLKVYEKSKCENQRTKNDFAVFDMRISRSNLFGLEIENRFLLINLIKYLISCRIHHELPAIIRAKLTISFVIRSGSRQPGFSSGYPQSSLNSLISYSPLKIVLHVLSFILSRISSRISIKSRRVKISKSCCAKSFVSGSSIF